MGTQRLYYTDSYVTDFDAIVVDRASDGMTVYLDRTAFYPTSGGQAFDTGVLGDVAVLDVVDEGERIAHRLKAPLRAETRQVMGRVDWTRRFDHMQQHTGQHLLSAVFADLYGFETVSVHFGDESSTLDLSALDITPEQLARAEERANEIVAGNRPVSVSFEDAATAPSLRKVPDRPGTLRIVTIADLDRSACGGTHVRGTAEIGPILIRGTERVRKTVRVAFVCGLRAIRRARADASLITRLAATLTAAPEELPRLVEAQRAEVAAAAAARKALIDALAGYRARELYDAATPGADGLRRIVAHRDAASADELRPLAASCAGLPRVAFIGTSADPPSVVYAVSEDSGIDAGASLKEALAHWGGRGGGNKRIAQGTVPDPGDLPRVVALLTGGSAGTS